MPRIRTPASTTEWYLLRGKRAEIMKKAGFKRGTYYNRLDNPGDLKLSEVGPLARDLTDEQIVKVIRAWS